MDYFGRFFFFRVVMVFSLEICLDLQAFGVISLCPKKKTWLGQGLIHMNFVEVMVF